MAPWTVAQLEDCIMWFKNQASRGLTRNLSADTEGGEFHVATHTTNMTGEHMQAHILDTDPGDPALQGHDDWVS